MQAVILAAGRGERMGALTELTPKPMLKVAGKNLIEHKLDVLPSNIDEVVIIVGYLGSEIQKYFGGVYKGKRLLYVVQEQARGTADALWQAKDFLHDQFLVLNGDDLYAQADLIRCMVHQDGWYLLAKDVPEDYVGGIVEMGDDGSIVRITENTVNHVHGKAGMNVYLLDTRVFAAPLVPKAPGSSEFGLPQTVLAAAQQMHIPFRTEKADFWIQITSPEDLARAQVLLSK
jgi:NDP-sugar pyrophosphorylase family protein